MVSSEGSFGVPLSFIVTLPFVGAVVVNVPRVGRSLSLA